MIYSRCLEEGVDITKDWIPVFPCQHYLMGGIKVDLDAATTVEGLYAVGECSNTGVHGANRLASNSLLEALVFSRRAAEDIMRHLSERGRQEITAAPPVHDIHGELLPKGIRTEIREIMQDTYFVIPKLDKVEESYKRVDEIVNKLITTKYEINADYVEARSLAIVAGIILGEVNGGINL